MRIKNLLLLAPVATALVVLGLYLLLDSDSPASKWPTPAQGSIVYKPREFGSGGGLLFTICLDQEPFKDPESLESIRQRFRDVRADLPDRVDKLHHQFTEQMMDERMQPLIFRAQIALWNGKPD